MTQNSQLIGRFLRNVASPNSWNAGAQIAEAEIQELERAFEEYDNVQTTVRSWLRAGGKPHFEFFTADDAIFSRIPLGAAEAACTSSYSQSLLHDTATIVAFDTKTPVFNDTYFKIDPDDHKVTIQIAPLRILVLGYYGIGSSDIGYMRMKIQRWNGSGVSQGFQIIDRSKLASPSNGTISAFARSYNTLSHGIKAGDYYKFEFYQNSGATLTCDTFQALFVAVT